MVKINQEQQLPVSIPENLRVLAKQLTEGSPELAGFGSEGRSIVSETKRPSSERIKPNNDKPDIPSKDRSKDADENKKLSPPIEPDSDYNAKREYVKDVVIPGMQAKIRNIKSSIAFLADTFEIDLGNQITVAQFDRQGFRAAVMRAERELPKKVMGQAAAIAPVIAALKRAAVGIRDEKRPIVSALAVGRTGVGKSLLAKELAHSLNQDDQLKFGFLKINCSEYSNGHEGARLTGAPPGYIGFDKPSPLKAVVENPFHVILFDEVEKGNGKLHDLFLQILEDGELTLSNGATVSFKNCIILFSSNIGVAALDQAHNPFGLPSGSVREALDADAVAELTHDALKQVLRPELINRLDAVIAFSDIDRATALKIAGLEVEYAIKRARQANPGCQITFDAEVISKIWNVGYSAEYGARELRRAVQKHIEEPLATAMFAIDPEKISQYSFEVCLHGKQIVVKSSPLAPVLNGRTPHPLVLH